MGDCLNLRTRVIVDYGVPFSSPDGVPLWIDVFRPDTGRVLPGIVTIVGGGWRSSVRMGFDSYGLILSSWGYVVANVTYRTAPEHKWPACMQDVKTAVRWLRAHAGTYRLDPGRIGAIGSSAGGHLAAMLALTPADEPFGGTLHTDQPGNVQAAVCLCAPVDLVVIHEVHKEGDGMTHLLPGTPEEVPEVYRIASPCSYVSEQAPPIFFIHGEADDIVPVGPTREMSERLRACGVDSPFVGLPETGHGVRGALEGAGEGGLLPQVRQFLAKHLAAR